MVNEVVPTKTWVKKTYTGGTGFSKGGAGRETPEERLSKQRAINRQSARRDAIDFLTAQNKPFTLEDVFVTATKLFDWVEKKD